MDSDRHLPLGRPALVPVDRFVESWARRMAKPFGYAAIIVSAGCRPAGTPTPNQPPAAAKANSAPNSPSPPPPPVRTHVMDLELPEGLDHSRPISLEKQRQERDETVWKKERQAQEYERALVRLWDQLIDANRHADGDPFAVLRAVPLQQFVVGSQGESQPIRWGATVTSLDHEPQSVDAKGWSDRVEMAKASGYRIVQTEWHHAKFEERDDGSVVSTVTMAIYAEHPVTKHRLVVSGDLLVQWQPQRDADQIPLPSVVDASQLKWYQRDGSTGFTEIFSVDHARPDTRAGVQPVLVQDLNDDGLAEIVLGGCNEIYWNRGQGQFDKSPLSLHWERGFEVGLLADLNGDGQLDYLQPGAAGDLLLYVGDEQGKFSKPPLGRVRGGGPLKQPQVLSAGDIDRDGDLDIWLGQYKISYVQGQMPTPYYDANDGFPAYLLANDGQGHFTPITEEAGLAAKSRRRSYGGSFVDLDRDGDLDLVVVSDFAGVDLYENNGKGYFTDITDKAVDERHLFGMALTFGDYNVDGWLDFFATGMASTTARRLEFLRLGRRDRADIHLMRSRMGYGNRMYLGQAGGFQQPAFRDQVARTGWSWGATTLDVDNDRFPEIFVANGHSSGASTKDHCSHFWCHDIYDATSEPNLEVLQVFNQEMKGYFDRSESWDGYQKNALLANLDGQSFVNLAFLMGVGQEFDGRAAISDDLDGDGRRDLVVVEDRWRDGQLLHVYRNGLESSNHWIGVRCVERPGHDSPLGARVVLIDNEGAERTAVIVAGDSIHAQHATVTHFGLGSQTHVARLEIHLASGRIISLDQPAIDQYHRVEIE